MKPFGDPTPIQRDYEFAEYRAESTRHELLGSVYIQVDGAIDDPLAETAWVDTVFENTGLKHAIVALVDLSRADAPLQLEAQSAYRRVSGVRQIIARLDEIPSLCFAPEHWLRDAQWRANFATLAEFDLSFDLQLYPEQMSEAAEFLARHPTIPVIVNHAGCAHDRSTSGLEHWKNGVARLATLPHVNIKLSGFGMYDPNWSSDSIRPQLAHILDCFGPERILFGSNFPVDKLMRSFDRLFDSVRHALVGIVAEPVVGQDDASIDLSAREDALLRLIFSENASRVYRLN